MAQVKTSIFAFQWDLMCLECHTSFDLGNTEAQEWEVEVHIQDPYLLLMVQPGGLCNLHFQLVKVS